MGEQKVSFFYGYTGPGQAYASLFPHRVRAMAMGSPLDHSVAHSSCSERAKPAGSSPAVVPAIIIG
ncbi:hypothetical protein [Amycolatopsis balhimycina]|uniref:hypothetical protein n=1 Tax=Amycolatopsis balhimycina TaxID=208443 RepID=UPI00035F91AF|nr:hypothetical protein [Amycolatopsis balhimycina]